MNFPLSGPRARDVFLTLSLFFLGACAGPANRPLPPAEPPATPIEAPAPAPAEPTPVALPAVALPSGDAERHDASLPAELEAFLAEPRFRHARWGIHVRDGRDGSTIHARAADGLFTPASVTKLPTAALALRLLGPETRFSTRLLTTASRQGSTLKGDLVLAGGGDPSLGDVRITAETSGWADAMAAAVARLGISQVDGDLVGDAGLFRGAAFGGGWEAADLEAAWAPPATALSANGNSYTLDIRRRDDGVCCEVLVRPEGLARDVVNLTPLRGYPADAPLTVLRRAGEREIRVSGSLRAGERQRQIRQAAIEPPLLALLDLRRALAARGVRLNGRLRVLNAPEAPFADGRTPTELARLASPPVAGLVRHMLKQSDNLIAQTLLLQAGVRAAALGQCSDRLRPPDSTEAWGLCALRALLREAGVDGAEAHFTEGSGLSRHNLVSPAALTGLLRWIDAQPFAEALQDALPVAGVDGTLRGRLANLPPGIRVRAKTGALSNVYTLAGEIRGADDRVWFFALMLNDYQRPRDELGRRLPPAPSRDLDTAVEMLVADFLRRQPGGTGKP